MMGTVYSPVVVLTQKGQDKVEKKHSTNEFAPRYIQQQKETKERLSKKGLVF